MVVVRKALETAYVVLLGCYLARFKLARVCTIPSDIGNT
jgi:hypothetical protein